MPTTHVELARTCQLATFAGYQFAEPPTCPAHTTVTLDIPFQRAPHYAPRLAIYGDGAVARYVLEADRWLLAGGAVRLPAGNRTAPSRPVGKTDLDAAS